jgi:hypothetical protein
MMVILSTVIRLSVFAKTTCNVHQDQCDFKRKRDDRNAAGAALERNVILEASVVFVFFSSVAKDSLIGVSSMLGIDVQNIP